MTVQLERLPVGALVMHAEFGAGRVHGASSSIACLVKFPQFKIPQLCVRGSLSVLVKEEVVHAQEIERPAPPREDPEKEEAKEQLALFE